MKLNQVFLTAATALAVVAFNPMVNAQGTARDDFLSSGSGGPVRDPFGDCVGSPGGSLIAECNPVVAVAPAPAPIVMSLSADTAFEFDRSELQPAGRTNLDRLVQDINNAGEVNSIDIVGHTDAVGSDAYNQRLSEDRAQSVSDYLVSRGVNPGLIRTSGMGESQPIATNETDLGRAQNRRVEITVDARNAPPEAPPAG